MERGIIAPQSASPSSALSDGMIGYMLAHEQFAVPDLSISARPRQKPGSISLRRATTFSRGKRMRGIRARPG
jgi:hypothetical protein